MTRRQGSGSRVGKKGEARIKDPARQASRSSHALGRALARSARGRRRSDQLRACGRLPGHARPAQGAPPRPAARARARPQRRRALPDRDGETFPPLVRPDEKEPLGGEGSRAAWSACSRTHSSSARLSPSSSPRRSAPLRLTEQQYRVLDMLSRQSRVAIAGCAGSGKTFLAAEKARRLAAQGFRVLLVVFNVLLAEHLRRGLADVPEVTRPRLLRALPRGRRRGGPRVRRGARARRGGRVLHRSGRSVRRRTQTSWPAASTR